MFVSVSKKAVVTNQFKMCIPTFAKILLYSFAVYILDTLKYIIFNSYIYVGHIFSQLFYS